MEKPMTSEEYFENYPAPEGDEVDVMPDTILIGREEVTYLRDMEDRLTNILGMKEQVVDNLREELQHMYDNGEFSYVKATRKAQIKGQLGQLEYDVKLLKGILSGE